MGEIPWWEMPDEDEDDELTWVCKKVLKAGDYDHNRRANRIQSNVIQFVLKLKLKAAAANANANANAVASSASYSSSSTKRGEEKFEEEEEEEQKKEEVEKTK